MTFSFSLQKKIKWCWTLARFLNMLVVLQPLCVVGNERTYFYPLSLSWKHHQSNKLILSFKTRFSFSFLFFFLPPFCFSFSSFFFSQKTSNIWDHLVSCNSTGHIGSSYSCIVLSCAGSSFHACQCIIVLCCPDK